MADAHEEKETLKVDVLIPEHADRGSASPLFRRSRLVLIEREGDRCWICGRTSKETGKPNHAHHHPIERCFALEIDFDLFAEDCRAGIWGSHCKAYDWDGFLAKLTDVRHDAEEIIYSFVDDMTANGMLCCPDCHIMQGVSMHMTPFPIVLARKYAKTGTQFTPTLVVHRDPVAEVAEGALSQGS